MIKIRCVVERITYQNPENGYSILKVKVKDYSDLVTVVGNLLDVPVGSVLLCDGDWKVDKRYGRQFVAQTWEEVMPATLYGMEKYLGSGLVKGIGPKVASCALLFGHAKLDAFPVDVWIKKVLLKYFDEDFSPESLGEYAGVAQQYLFYYERYLQSSKGE